MLNPKTIILSFAALVLGAAIAGACGGSTAASDAGGAATDSGGVVEDAGGGGGDAGAPDAGVEVYPAEAKLTRGPWLGSEAQGVVTVRWETDREAVPAVKLGGAGSGTVKGTSEPFTFKIGIDAREVSRVQHSVTLDGLPAGQSVTYELPDLKTPVTATFVTAPATPKPFRFAVYGDTRPAGPYLEENAKHLEIATAMAAELPDFYIHTGDMAFSGGMEGEWYLFFATSAPIMPSAPIYPVFGNHEDGGEARWEQLFSLPGDGAASRYYSWDYANTHFAVLCVECGIDAGSAQITWLNADLAAAKGNAAIEHIFVSFHNPAYTYSSHAPDAAAQQNIAPLLKQYGVRAVFNGHNHLYERIVMDGITYLVLGGGGAPLYDEDAGDKPGLVKGAKVYHYAVLDVNGASVQVKVKTDTGVDLESFTLP